MASTAPTHYVKPNEAERAPHVCVYVDTEATIAADDGGETHTLRLWSVCVQDRRKHPGTVDPDSGDQPGVTWHDGRTVEELADLIVAQARSRVPVWVFAHNVAYDLWLTGLVDVLTERGWELTSWSPARKAPHFRFVSGYRSIRLADSYAYLPKSLDDIARAIGRVKPPVNFARAVSDKRLAARCRADTGILAAAMSELIGWWAADGGGVWQPTGAGCGWSFYRHRFLTERVVIDGDPEARAEERAWCFGGRRDAFRVGHFKTPVAELDLEHAYAQVAEHAWLPAERLHFTRPRPLDWFTNLPEDLGAVATVTIRAPDPIVPVRVDGRTVWPVGTWTGPVAGPELALAIEAGQVVEVHRVRMYRLAPFMADWGRWVGQAVTGGGGDLPVTARLAAKHWVRTVPGRWAAKSSSSTLLGPAGNLGWHSTEGMDAATGRLLSVVDIAGKRWELEADGDSRECFPAVFGWITSECRAVLWRILAAADPDRVLVADTDGLLMLRDRQGVPPALAAASSPYRLRWKASYKRAWVGGPANLRVDDHWRIAGVQTDDRQGGRKPFTVTEWPSMTWQMRYSAPGAYRRPKREITRPGLTGSRWVLADGSTVPVEVRPGPGGRTVVVPWGNCVWARLGLRLAAAQPEWLHRYQHTA